MIRIIIIGIISIVILSNVIGFVSNNKLNGQQERKLNIYNWSEFINQETIKSFAEKNNIKVKYDVYDSDQVLDAKLYIDRIGYDIVVPSTYPFLLRQSKLGIYQKIDKSKLKNYKNLDPKILEIMHNNGKLDEYGIPWMWGTIGIGYNTDKISDPIDSLEYIFNENYLKKYHKCGVMFIDSPNEIISLALLYLGLDPNSEKTDDLEQVKKLLLKIRPYITQFHSSKYIYDLANGDICMAVGFSGDIMIAKKNGKVNNNLNIKYIIPKEGSEIWIDSLAIPKKASNITEAYEFLDYLLDPQIAADNTNNLGFANANIASQKFINKDILNDKMIYIPNDVIQKLFIIKPLSLEAERKRNYLWTSILNYKTTYNP